MSMRFDRRSVLAGGAAALGFGVFAPRQALAQTSYRAAADYSASHNGISMLVMHRGRIVFEDYPNGGAADRPHELASGTKSFCGIMAAAAVQDRLMRLDELAVETLPEWRDDPLKKRITIRQILALTSGLRTRRARGDLLSYSESVGLEAVAEPGTRFAYGGDPFQLFGAILHRKLREKEDPVQYLTRRVLDPAGVAVGFWRRGPDDDLPRLGSGARLTARNWAHYGEWVRNGGVAGGRQIVDRAALEEGFRGSSANPAYGLGWWLNRPMPAEQRDAIPQLRNATDVRPEIAAFPRDLVLAAGAGKQRLYISRADELVVVRQADRIREAQARRGLGGFSDSEFWTRLRAG